MPIFHVALRLFVQYLNFGDLLQKLKFKKIDMVTMVNKHGRGMHFGWGGGMEEI